MRVWNRHMGIARILTSLALTLTWMPAALARKRKVQVMDPRSRRG